MHMHRISLLFSDFVPVSGGYTSDVIAIAVFFFWIWGINTSFKCYWSNKYWLAQSTVNTFHWYLKRAKKFVQTSSYLRFKWLVQYRLSSSINTVQFFVRNSSASLFFCFSSDICIVLIENVLQNFQDLQTFSG